MVPNSKVSVSVQYYLGGTLAKSNWMCGLKCRRVMGCVAYNYNSGTEECQLLGLKKSANGSELTWGATSTKLTVIEERLSDWSYNEREN